MAIMSLCSYHLSKACVIRTPSGPIMYKYTFIRQIKILEIIYESTGMEAC